jgi:restriction system protein
MMFGSGTFGSMPFGGVPPDFTLDLARPDQAAQESLIQIVSFLDRQLIEVIRRDHASLRTIDRHQFEQLIAEIFNGFGYEVELTQRTRDGGKDIVAVRRREIECRLLIECKRPDPGNAINVSIVRALLGVKVDDGATKAILATTTRLTRDAHDFVEKHRWELEAAEFDKIIAWIELYKNETGRGAG